MWAAFAIVRRYLSKCCSTTNVIISGTPKNVAKQSIIRCRNMPDALGNKNAYLIKPRLYTVNSFYSTMI